MRNRISFELMVIIIPFLLFFVGVASVVLWKINRPTEVYELVSINNSSQVSGSFFLGSGTISERPVFYYYAKKKDGSLVLSYAYASISNIYEDSTAPSLVVKHSLDTRYEFHIPKGSVIRDFTLDVSEIK